MKPTKKKKNQNKTKGKVKKIGQDERVLQRQDENKLLDLAQLCHRKTGKAYLGALEWNEKHTSLQQRW